MTLSGKIPNRLELKLHRQAFCQRLTGRLLQTENIAGELLPNKICRVLVCRPNHRLGNLLALTPLMAELENQFPGAEVDILASGGVANEIFRSFRSVGRIYCLPRHPFKHAVKYARTLSALRKRKYDLVVNTKPDSSTGRIISKMVQADYRMPSPTKAILSNRTDQSEQHFAKSPVVLLRQHLTRGNYLSRVPGMDLRLSDAEKNRGKSTLKRLMKPVADGKKATFALFTHATGNKCYPRQWWQTLLAKLRIDFPDHAFLEILPAHACSGLDFTIPVFYSSDIRKMAAVLSTVDMFVGADGGVMHLASASGTQTIGLFSITDPYTFKPYGASNAGIFTKDMSPGRLSSEIRKISIQVDTSAFGIRNKGRVPPW